MTATLSRNKQDLQTKYCFRQAGTLVVAHLPSHAHTVFTSYSPQSWASVTVEACGYGAAFCPPAHPDPPRSSPQLVPQYRDQFVAKRPGWLDALVGGGGSKE